MKKHLFIATLTLALSANILGLAAELKIEVSDIRNANGNLLLSITTNEKSFEDNKKPYVSISIKANKPTQTISIGNIPVGNYAISVTHDENENLKFDVNSRNFPEEGYGYSNNVGTAEVPSFSDAAFTLNSTQTETQKIKLVYIK